MKKIEFDKFLGIFVTIIIMLGSISYAVIVAQFYEYPGQYWYSAPDGTYRVEGGPIENGSVFFPMCPTAPTELHGSWQVASNVTTLDWMQSYHVTLRSNVIVDAIKIPIDTSTVYGQFDQMNYDHRNSQIFIEVTRSDASGSWENWYIVKNRTSIYDYECPQIFGSMNMSETLEWAINYWRRG